MLEQMSILSIRRFSTLALLVFSVSLRAESPPEQLCRKYCTPELECWPSETEIVKYINSLYGGYRATLRPGDTDFIGASYMKDLLYTRKIAMISYCFGPEDIKKAMIFAKMHDIRFTIRSSGHSFIGRSTATGSLMIDVSFMKGVHVDLNDPRHVHGLVTVKPGNTWIEVYREVDKFDRVVVGGSAHTVSVAGYMMGGGHSPLTPTLGLAVDHVVSFTIITAEGLERTCTPTGMTTTQADGTVVASNSTDLFWAVRGGGGGTFGVLISITFKLHLPPSSFVQFACLFPYNLADGTIIGDSVLGLYNEIAPSIPSQWGGYLILGTNIDPNINSRGFILFAMLHFGNWSEPSSQYFEPLMNLHSTHSKCSYVNYTTFLEYEVTINDPIYVRFYLNNQLLHRDSFTSDLIQYYKSLIYYNPKREYAYYSCTSVHLGGNSSAVTEPSAVSPMFRTAITSTSCAVGWVGDFLDDELIANLDNFQTEFSKLGNGSYFNEPSAHLVDWRQQFWGGHYDRLFSIKRAYDPDYFFTCLQCVGSDQQQGNPCAGQPVLTPPLTLIAFFLLYLYQVDNLKLA